MSSLNINPVDGAGNPIANAIRIVGIMDAGGQPCPCEPAIRIQSNFWQSQKTYAQITGHPGPFLVYGACLANGKGGYFSQSWDGMGDLPITVTLGFRRPLPVNQPLLGAFDGNWNGNLIHTSLPPDFVLPTMDDKDIWCGACWSVTLDSTPPSVPGCNTTPREMVMSYQTHFYDRPWQDTVLTAHAVRNFKNFHLSGPGSTAEAPADPADPTNIQNTLDLMEYVQSWGFQTSCWLPGYAIDAIRNTNWNGARSQIEPFLKALAARPDIVDRTMGIVLGKELDGWNAGGPNGLDDIIGGVCDICIPSGINVWLHFNANKPGWPAPGQNIVEWWAWLASIGVKGITWQANQDDHPADMSAHFADTRKYLAAANMKLRASAWELDGENNLYFGNKPKQLPWGNITFDEDRSALTAWELCCATAPTLGAWPPVAGSMNGPRRPDGSPLMAAV